MARITILGAGITSLSIAYSLPKSHRITILASDLPGDLPHSQTWASPHACAGWVALGGLNPLEEQMQLDALCFLRRLAITNPESGVRRARVTDVHDEPDANGPWYRNRVPGYSEQEQQPSQISQDGQEGSASLVTSYGSVVMDPSVLLPWLRRELESQGVEFVRVGRVERLGELGFAGGDVVVNASGLGSLALADVADDRVVSDRTYTVRVRSRFEGMFVRRGKGHQYTYVFGRGDGTAVLGGISDPVGDKVRTSEEVRAEIIRRAHENLVEYFPSADPSDYEVVEDMVGIRPLRFAGVRVEKETIGGQNVVHAYGTTIGGYIHSFGLARQAARLVDDFLFQL